MIVFVPTLLWREDQKIWNYSVTHLDKFLVVISLVVDGSQRERIEMMKCDL